MVSGSRGRRRRSSAVVPGICVALFAVLAMPARADEIQDAGDALKILIPGAVLVGTVVHEKRVEGAYQLFLSVTASQIVTEGLKAAKTSRPTSWTTGARIRSFMTRAWWLLRPP